MGRSEPYRRLQKDEWSSLENAVLKTYEPLLDRQVRVLRLLPGRGDEIVRCRLVAVDIDSNPTYEAISYTWGKARDVTKMILNGNICWRKLNLLECLQSLRQKSKTRLLWVDALCINQADTVEKSSQINLMPWIYRSAARTLIWLGKDAEFRPPRELPHVADERLFFDIALSSEAYKYSEALNLLSHFAKNRHVHSDVHFQELSQGLYHIVQFEWWCRIWVVQETLLSKSAYLVLGSFMMPWQTAYQGAVNIVHHLSTCCHNPVDPGEYEVGLSEALATCAEVILSFQPIPSGTANASLANLWTFRNRAASVDHDKIYGLLGLLRASESRLQPEYRISFMDLCRSVIIEDIRLSGNLNALLGSKVAGTLSWTTNWGSMYYWTEERSRILAALYSQVYRASGASRPQLNILPDSTKQARHRDINNNLPVAGRIFDVVVHIGARLVLAIDPDGHAGAATQQPGTSSVLQSAEKIRQLMEGDDYVGGGSIFSALWRTLLADCLIPWPDIHDPLRSIRASADRDRGLSLRRTKASDFLAFALWCASEPQRFTKIRRGPNVHGGSLVDDMESSYGFDRLLSPGKSQPFSSQPAYPEKCMLARTLIRMPAVRNIRASIIRATSGRRLFITKQGFIGLGPEFTREGDSIAVFLGGSTPFVLRGNHASGIDQQTWLLMGDCYVHGWMDGEMMKNEDASTWDDLVLV